jgi:hypothetical protein
MGESVGTIAVLILPDLAVQSIPIPTELSRILKETEAKGK